MLCVCKHTADHGRRMVGDTVEGKTKVEKFSKICESSHERPRSLTPKTSLSQRECSVSCVSYLLNVSRTLCAVDGFQCYQTFERHREYPHTCTPTDPRYLFFRLNGRSRKGIITFSSIFPISLSSLKLPFLPFLWSLRVE